MNIKRTLLLAGILTSISSGLNAEGLTLGEIQKLDLTSTATDLYKNNNTDESSIRWKTLRSTALSIGAQHGYYHRTGELIDFFEENEDLMQIFDFGVLMRMTSFGEEQMFFVPPVIVEANNVMAVSDDDRTVRVSGKLYNIKRSSRLSLRAPHWKQYLTIRDEFKPSVPNKALLPKNPIEKSKWKTWVSEGWNAGIEQADEEMKLKINNLGEDFIGMVKYMRLVDEGKIREPNISKLKQKVVNGGSSMRENEAIYQLSIPAIFNSDTDDWNPLYGDSRDGFLLPQEIN